MPKYRYVIEIEAEADSNARQILGDLFWCAIGYQSFLIQSSLRNGLDQSFLRSCEKKQRTV